MNTTPTRARLTMAALCAALIVLATPAYRAAAAGITLTSRIQTTENGFPANDIRCIAQDERGYMWFGSLYALYRYDGYAYKRYVPTATGTTRMLMDRHIRTLKPLPGGLMLIEQNGHYYSIYDCRAERFTDYTGCGRYNTPYRRWSVDSNGNVTLSDPDRGTAIISTGSKGPHTTYYPERKLPPAATKPQGYIADSRGNTVRAIGTGRISYTDRHTGQKFSIDAFPDYLVRMKITPRYKVVTQQNGLVWVSTYGNGIFVYDKNSRALRHITKDSRPQLINSNFIIAMTEDREGNIWVAQEHRGVACITADRQWFDVVTFAGGDAGERMNEVRMLALMPGGRLLAANNYGMLAEINRGRADIISRSADINYIAHATDTAGRMWFGTKRNGLIVGQANYLHDPANPTSPAANRIDCIVRDAKGRIWLSGIDGYVSLAVPQKDGGMAFRHFFRGRREFEPRKMLLDDSGRIWVASVNELIVFSPDRLMANPRSFRPIPLKTPDSRTNTVLCLHKAPDGLIYIGTNGSGMVVMDQQLKNVNTYSTANGLNSNVVKFIKHDTHGNIWAGTDNGCTVIAPGGKATPLYFGADPLLNTLNEDCAAALPDGRMALGSQGGLIITGNPYRNAAEKRRPITFTDILVNGTPIELADSTAPSAANTSRLTLQAHLNTVSVSFTDFNYGADKKLSRYSFRLSGTDRQWSGWSTLNTATYRHLPPGSYTLTVRSQAGAQASMDIVVKPPFYASAWAFAIYLLIAAAVAVAIYRYLLTVWRLRREIAVEKRLAEFKINFFTDISHEFRTPLSLIKATMEQMASMADSRALAGPMASLQRNADRMMRLINQLLEFRRMEEGKLHLRLEQGDMVEFLRRIADSFRYAAAHRGIGLTFLPADRQCVMAFDHGFIDKIVYELLSNAMKYTPRGGCVTLRTRTEGGRRLIIVEDTGIGVEPERRGEIFERYAHGHHNRSSLGIGLNLTAGLAAAHHGSIAYTDNPGGGSIFTLSIPAGQDEYLPTDYLATGSPLNADSNASAEPYMAYTHPAAGAPAAEAINSARVLVVDDDDDIAFMLRQQLGAWFVVDTASDGHDAIGKMNECVPDLVISDIRMPGMNGHELVRHIRRSARLKGVPVILLTAIDDEQTRISGLMAGADAYLTKPFSIRLLLMQCRNLIARSGSYAGKKQEEEKQKKTLAPAIITEERDRKFLDALYIYINSHLADTDLQVDKMSAAMNYGRTKFYNKVKQLTGKTPNDLVRERRLQRAAELLKDDTVTVSEVAYQVGMTTPQYLSTSFKKYYGITPSQYQMKKGGGGDLGSKEDFRE